MQVSIDAVVAAAKEVQDGDRENRAKKREGAPQTCLLPVPI
jgi:hypothetical protein